MDTERVRQLCEWLAATDIGLLELTGPGTHLRLGCDAALGATRLDSANGPAAAACTTPVAVAAPSVGVFLHRHPLQEAPLAQRGTRVSRGQPLGLLRIGALLLPVSAPHDGRVAEVLAADGAAVGYGTPLVDFQPL